MKYHGEVTVFDPDADKPILTSGTLQCVHCQKHWVPEPGSGRMRGFCQNCMGPICGPGCAKCVHWEQMIENIEKGRPLDYKPIQASVLMPD